MKSLDVSRRSVVSHPLDVVERIVDENDWPSDRRDDCEMAVQAPGRWCDYSLYFSWNEDVGTVHFTCAFDLRVSTERRPQVYELLALINEKVCLGHFGIWHKEGLPMYRHALLLRGSSGPSQEQVEDMMNAAIIECERFYPAFQYVLWGGRTASEAVEAAMVDTQGEA